MQSFKVFELVVGFNPFSHKKEFLSYPFNNSYEKNLNLSKDTIEQLNEEVIKHKLESTKFNPIFISKTTQYNVGASNFFLTLTDNKKEYTKFISVGGLETIPEQYNKICCSILVKTSEVNIKQIYNLKIENDIFCDYIFLDIKYDYERLKLSSFKKR